MMLPQFHWEVRDENTPSTHLLHSKTLNPIPPNMALFIKLPKLINLGESQSLPK